MKFKIVETTSQSRPKMSNHDEKSHKSDLASACACIHAHTGSPINKVAFEPCFRKPQEMFLAIISSKRSLDLPPFGNDGGMGIPPIQRVHHGSLGCIFGKIQMHVRLVRFKCEVF